MYLLSDRAGRTHAYFSGSDGDIRQVCYLLVVGV